MSAQLVPRVKLLTHMPMEASQTASVGQLGPVGAVQNGKPTLHPPPHGTSQLTAALSEMQAQACQLFC